MHCLHLSDILGALTNNEMHPTLCYFYCFDRFTWDSLCLHCLGKLLKIEDALFQLASWSFKANNVASLSQGPSIIPHGRLTVWMSHSGGLIPHSRAPMQNGMHRCLGKPSLLLAVLVSIDLEQCHCPVIISIFLASLPPEIQLLTLMN